MTSKTSKLLSHEFRCAEAPEDRLRVRGPYDGDGAVEVTIFASDEAVTLCWEDVERLQLFLGELLEEHRPR